MGNHMTKYMLPDADVDLGWTCIYKGTSKHLYWSASLSFVQLEVFEYFEKKERNPYLLYEVSSSFHVTFK